MGLARRGIYIRCVHTRTLRTDIVEELQGDPRLDATRITVTESEAGTVILSGSVHNYPERCWAEEVAGRIAGVTAVQNDLEVRLTIGEYRSDETLQRIICEILEALAAMPQKRPEAIVRGGWLTLRGRVPWPCQKRLVEQAVSPIAGIRGITNHIDVMQPT